MFAIPKSLYSIPNSFKNKQMSLLLHLPPIKRAELHLHRHSTTKRHYDIFKINNLIFRFSSFDVSKYKEMLLEVEMNDLFIKYYTIEECQIKLHEIYDRYHKYVVVYPSYLGLAPINKVITDNIFAKQQLINMNYETDLLKMIHISYDSVLSFEDSITQRHGKERKSSFNSFSIRKAKIAERSQLREVKTMTFQERNSSLDEIIDFANIIDYFVNKPKRRLEAKYCNHSSNAIYKLKPGVRNNLKKISRKEWLEIIEDKDKGEMDMEIYSKDKKKTGDEVIKGDNLNEDSIKLNTQKKTIDNLDLSNIPSNLIKSQSKKNIKFVSIEEFIDVKKERIKNKVDFKSKTKMVRDEIFKGFLLRTNKPICIKESRMKKEKNNCKKMHQSCSLPKISSRSQIKKNENAVKDRLTDTDRVNKSTSQIVNNAKIMKCFVAKCILMLYPSESYKDMGNKNNTLNNKRFVANNEYVKVLKSKPSINKYVNMSIESNQNNLTLNQKKE